MYVLDILYSNIIECVTISLYRCVDEVYGQDIRPKRGYRQL